MGWNSATYVLLFSTMKASKLCKKSPQHLENTTSIPEGEGWTPGFASELKQVKIVHQGHSLIWYKTCVHFRYRREGFWAFTLLTFQRIHWDVELLRNNERIMKFLIVGCSAAVVNFLLITIFIELLGFKSYFLKNLANVLAIELSAIYNFSISRAWKRCAQKTRQKPCRPVYIFQSDAFGGYRFKSYSLRRF